MSDLTARAIADLKAELAESKAAANRVTESMGSEIMRLTAELEQQRTRAEAVEQELRDYTAHVAQSRNEDRSKLAAIRAHLAGWDPMALDNWARGYGKGSAAAQVFAAAREALEP